MDKKVLSNSVIPQDSTSTSDQPKTKYVCTQCGSDDVEAVAMCKLNTDPPQFVDWACFDDTDVCFCNQCDDWTTWEEIKIEESVVCL